MGLTSNTTEEDLQQMFDNYGSVTSYRNRTSSSIPTSESPVVDIMILHEDCKARP